MSHWHLTLQDDHNGAIAEWKAHLSDALQLFSVEGLPILAAPWRFTKYGDPTQQGDGYICDFGLHGSVLSFKTTLNEVAVHPQVLDPQYEKSSHFDVPASTEANRFVILLRDGDRVTFGDDRKALRASFVLVPKSEANVEVESSAVSQYEPLNPEDVGEEVEIDDENENDMIDADQDDTQNDAQNPYSTSRERQSNSPRTPPENMDMTPAVQETPTHPPLKQQTSTISRVPDSLVQSEQSMAFAPSAEIPETLPAMTSQVTEQKRGSSPAPPDAEEEPVVLPDLDADLDVSLEDESSLLELGDDAANEAKAPSETGPAAVSGAEEDPPEEDLPGEDASEQGSPEEDMPAETTAQPPPSASTSTPKTRGKKRKTVSDVSTATPGASVKRTKRSEVEKLAIDNGTSNASTPLNSTGPRRRSSPRVVLSQDDGPLSPFDGTPPRVLFPSESTILKRKGLMGFLKTQKVKQVNDAKPKSFDMLCVGRGELKKTAKLLVSLIYGKSIVTDDWVVESSKVKKLLKPDRFLPETLKETMDKDRTTVFEGMIVYFTPKLRSDYKKGWDGIHDITKQAGAEAIHSCPPSKMPKNVQISLHLGAEKGDPHVATLQKKGIVVYSKDIISHSIIVGELLLDEDEFRLPMAEASNSPSSPAASVKTEPVKRPRGRPKKQK